MRNALTVLFALIIGLISLQANNFSPAKKGLPMDIVLPEQLENENRDQTYQLLLQDSWGDGWNGADKWDQQQGITNFIVLPLTFLSGTFYSISRLPEFWQKVSSFNPFFYNIDGFRYAFTGLSDSSLIHGVIFLVILNIILIFICYLMFHKGYKIKF